MLTTSDRISPMTERAGITERRFEMRAPVHGDLWMVDHNGATVLRCRCIDVSENGMCLHVPLGYGVAEGQRFELRSHLPGAPKSIGLGLVNRRWATVVRTQVHLGGGEDHLEVGVVLDANDIGRGELHTTPASA